MAKRKTVVKLPDGGVAIRSSETRSYQWAVMVATDCRARAARLRARADELVEVHRRVAEIIAGGDLTALERVHTSSNGRGEKSYSSRVPDIKVDHWLPDWQRPQEWEEYIDRALARLLSEAKRNRTEAGELDAGPQYQYAVFRWSERRDSADKAAHGYRGHPEDSVTVVPCQEA